MRTYTSQQPGILGFWREVTSLYRKNCLDNAPGWVHSSRVRILIDDIRKIEARVKDAFGLELQDLRVLEIGPGHHRVQMAYLSQRNYVSAIDLDIIPEGFDIPAYTQMLRRNGFRRVVKTIGRKALRIDRGYRSELLRQLNLNRFPKCTVSYMDACQMSFPPESFDFVYSRAVFHSLPDPAAALDQIVRVLKPGGVVHIELHLFTSPNGALDVRMYTDHDGEAREWAHLRPKLQATVQSATYVNKLHLTEWKRLFEAKMPGVQYAFGKDVDPQHESQARTLQANGELLDYTLEELLTYELDAMWQKPASLPN